jgi:site-specific DNA-methyltransferase (adenine-specific)
MAGTDAQGGVSEAGRSDATMRAYYESGGVTIYHGDCRDLSIEANLTLFDPPYGIGRRYSDAYDDRAEGYWEWFLPCLERLRRVAPVMAHTHRTPEGLRRITGYDWIAVWHKPYSAGARIGNSPVLPHWEPIFLYGIHSLGVKRQAFADVLSYNPESSPAPTKSASPRDKAKSDAGDNHPLPKPLPLMARLILWLSAQGETVYDPFAGSGTTLLAAKNLGRKAIGIEIEERYCEIAAKRLAQGVLGL